MTYITGYLVFYTTDPNLDDIRWVVEGVLGERLTSSIKGLTPDTTYYFKVQARNSKGYGPISPTVIYKTPKCKYYYLLVVRFMVFNATFNNISVISRRSVLLLEETGENHRPAASQ